MRRNGHPSRSLPVPAIAALLVAACSSSSGQPATAQVLDPTQPHYGNSDDVWGTAWFQWFYQLKETAGNCIVPITDMTGENCGYGQSGPVFFLAGTTGGTVERDKCVVPEGKAIFFPILNFVADNAGVPAGMTSTDSQLMADIQTQMDQVPVDGLSAEFDGLPIANLGQFRTAVTKYSYTLPSEPNVYTCLGESGVTGLVDPSYAAGFYVMLPPPAAGAHVLHFAGSSPKSSPPLKVDVTYKFTVK
jgi:hypothetical protein